MVRLPLIALAAAAWAAPALALTPDWGRAGGDLFARPAPPPAPAALRVPEAPDRVAAPDQPFDGTVRAAAERHGLDPKLLSALVLVESSYRPQAASPAGALGLTQLMPDTAAALGVSDRADPTQNLMGGAAFLARQVVRFGDLRLALAAYNAGPERVARLGRVPRIAETQAYVATVLECYLALAAGRKIRSSSQCRAGAPAS